MPAYFAGQLGGFTLPLGARRCADFARFYEPYDPERAAIKAAQGQSFGIACAAFRRQDYEQLAIALHDIATYKEQF